MVIFLLLNKQSKECGLEYLTCPLGAYVSKSPFGIFMVQETDRLMRRLTLGSGPDGLPFSPGPWIRGTLGHLEKWTEAAIKVISIVLKLHKIMC